MKPKITVVVPTLNRPQLAKVAVDSILAQEGGFSCEVILSNNGANAQTKELFYSEFYSNRIRYIESPHVLPMPIHWEWATRFASGEYLIVLPDRRLLKQGALRQLISAMDNNQDCEACCCCDEWLYASGRIQTTRTFSSDAKLSTGEVLDGFERGIFDRNSLPLALNSVLRASFLEEYRSRHGKYFDSISPDFRSAFNFLFTARGIYVIAEPLLITTGFSLSNGGSAYKGDTSYLESLRDEGKFKFMPVQFEGNVWSMIFEDYLRSRREFRGECDYKAILSKPAISLIMTEELIKIVACRFSMKSIRHYKEIRKLVQSCGWSVTDDLRIMKGVIMGLKQFLPEPLKKIYRRIYASLYKKERNVLTIAGF